MFVDVGDLPEAGSFLTSQDSALNTQSNHN